MLQKYHEKKLKLKGLVKEIVPWRPFYDVCNVTFFKHPCVSSTLTLTTVATESRHGGGCEVRAYAASPWFLPTEMSCHSCFVQCLFFQLFSLTKEVD